MKFLGLTILALAVAAGVTVFTLPGHTGPGCCPGGAHQPNPATQGTAGAEARADKPAHEHGAGCAVSGCTAEEAVKTAQAETRLVEGNQTTCPVMGARINRAIFSDHEGKRVYFCCGGCVSRFNANPTQYLTRLEGQGVRVATIEQAAAPKEEAPAPAQISPSALGAIQRAGIPVTIVDARGGNVQSRIQGAKALTSRSSEEQIGQTLPDKNALIVTYCTNLQCPASNHLATRLLELGYKNVVELPEGIQGWTEHGGSVQTTPQTP